MSLNISSKKNRIDLFGVLLIILIIYFLGKAFGLW